MIGNFSENYSFLIQNAIQSQHWNKNQCTIHPFVIYGLEPDENGQPNFNSFVLISEFTNHYNVAVHTFQKKFINWLVEEKDNRIFSNLLKWNFLWRATHFFRDG